MILGAIAGDMIGSVYEFAANKGMDFPLWHPLADFTDDTILTIATAEACLSDRDFGGAYLRWARRYPHPMGDYGSMFKRWVAMGGGEPYNSYGNGSAMRVSPVAWLVPTVSDAIRMAEATALPTHNHEDGVRGAQATVIAIMRARQGWSRERIRQDVMEASGYDLTRTVDQIRPHYHFDVTCQGSVPESIICALESTDWEHAVRLAISLGGDADTMAAIAGSIAEAMYGGVPDAIAAEVWRRLPDDMRAVVKQMGDGVAVEG